MCTSGTSPALLSMAALCGWAARWTDRPSWLQCPEPHFPLPQPYQPPSSSREPSPFLSQGLCMYCSFFLEYSSSAYLVNSKSPFRNEQMSSEDRFLAPSYVGPSL